MSLFSPEESAGELKQVAGLPQGGDLQTLDANEPGCGKRFCWSRPLPARREVQFPSTARQTNTQWFVSAGRVSLIEPLQNQTPASLCVWGSRRRSFSPFFHLLFAAHSCFKVAFCVLVAEIKQLASSQTACFPQLTQNEFL